MGRRARAWLIGTLAALALLLACALLAVHLLLQPRRFTALLEDAAGTAGLKLTLAQPASPELFPSPGLVLQGLRLEVPGHAAPMLSATRGKLFVPWRALLGGAPGITRFELDEPQINLDEVDAFVAAMPAGRTPWLPRIRTGILLADGSLLRNGHPVLDALRITSGALEPGQPFLLTLAARNASGQPLSIRIAGVPSRSENAVALDRMQLTGSLPRYGDFSLAGQARWLGGSRAQLALSGRAGAPPWALHVAFSSTSAPAQLQLLAQRAGQRLQARFDPSALLAWWRGLLGSGHGLPALAPPPLAASASVARLQVGSVHIHGLSLQVDTAPAAARSAAGPVHGDTGRR